MKLLSLLVYIPLQILCLPLAIVAGVWVAYRQIGVSKRLGISQTAIEILNGRWTMHVFGLREDPATVNLARVLPNTSTAGLMVVLFPLWAKYKISGEHWLYPVPPVPGRESVGNFVIARTLYIDEIVERVLGDVEQFVLLGAGYDTRAYGRFARSGVRLFEVDQTSVQEHKRAMLRQARIDTGSVTFVPVDFSQDDLFAQLGETGYDPTKKTLFLWEGVTLYLSEADARRNMRAVAESSAAGSVLLADIYSSRFLQNLQKGGGKKTLDATGETLHFGLTMAKVDHEQELSRLASDEGLDVGQTFFFGSKDEKGPFMVVAEMVVKS